MAQVKPLYAVQKRPQPKKPPEYHSGHSQARSDHYAKNIVDKMNPTDAIPARRSYPGIPN